MELLGLLGLLERKFQTATWTVSRRPRTPRKAAKAAHTGFPGTQAAQTSFPGTQAAQTGRPSCWTGLQECSCRQTRPPLGPSPGRPGRLERPPRPPRQASQAPRQPKQAAPTAGMASRNARVDKPMRLATKPCSCLHCSNRQNTAPVDTASVDNTRFRQPPGLLLAQSTTSCPCRHGQPPRWLAPKMALVDKTLLLSTKHCSCRHCFRRQ